MGGLVVEEEEEEEEVNVVTPRGKKNTGINKRRNHRLTNNTKAT